MSASLSIQVQNNNDHVVVTLIGRIDEDAHFQDILAQKKTKYIFDFNGVNLINSCGVREWIGLLSQLPSGAAVVYRQCPQVMVEQMNMVQGFLPLGATIESFYAPYFDPDLDEEVKVLLTLDEVKGGKAPEKKNSSGNELEFDALEAQYFNFIK